MAQTSWVSKFMIALASDGAALMRPLSELVVAEPSVTGYRPFTSVAGKNGLGHVLRIGFPVESWQWNWLPQTDIDILRNYEAQNVIIQTETDEGASVRVFKIFSCYCQPLVLGPINRKVAWGVLDGARQKRPVTMEFAQLVLVGTGGTSFSV